ncbi:Succinate--hydroxymethylglutarate CoA-transferase [Fonsecaea pedrosoi]|nr:Succinate--hydroxymethylglutarate CoA-transferase [Fonsecaea pedrosoi]
MGSVQRDFTRLVYQVSSLRKAWWRTNGCCTRNYSSSLKTGTTRNNRIPFSRWDVQPRSTKQRGVVVLPHRHQSTLNVPSSEAFQFNAPSSRPLSDITIVALEQVISMPLATRHLADLGARVIKIERPGTGDFVRHHDKRIRGKLCSHFVWTNRNKESLALDIKKPQDMEVLRKLVCEKADVFVQNLRPGDAEKMGLGYEDMKAMMNAAFPGEARGDRLIYASISGYGGNGPYAHKKAYDLLVQAEAGLLSITGTKDEMAKVGCSIADIAAGIYAYSSILGAIIQRQKTGKGCVIDVSMLESLVEWMGFPLYYAFEGQTAPKRAGAAHASIYPYGPFSTGISPDGSLSAQVMLGVQNEREWKILAADVLEREDLTTNPKFKDTASRSDNRAELEAIISGIFASWGGGADEVVRRLEKAGIANAKVNDMQGVWEHEQLAARRRFGQVDTEVGPIPAFLPPGMSADVDARMDPIPAVGEHNDKILRELSSSKAKV